MGSLENPILMFTALFTLYSPLASLPSYFPILGRVDPRDQRRLAIGLFLNVTAFAMVAIWLGEPLLKLLGLTPAALMVTGGIALYVVGLPLMRGAGEAAYKNPDAEPPTAAPVSWRSVLSMPLTFPLTVGGTSFAIMVSFRAQARSTLEVVALSAAAILHAAVTGLTLYVSGQLERRLPPAGRRLLKRIAGILLTAISVTLLFKGGTRLVTMALTGRGDD